MGRLPTILAWDWQTSFGVQCYLSATQHLHYPLLTDTRDHDFHCILRVQRARAARLGPPPLASRLVVHLFRTILNMG
jgi:hypothetical protein